MHSQLRYPHLYAGPLVRLAALDPERDAAALARWSGDTEYRRWLDNDAVRGETAAAVKAAMEKRAERPTDFPFGIHLAADDTFIGFVRLWIRDWSNAEAFVGIGIGDRAYWSKGYGSAAMQLALRFAFHELNLERVSLEANAENARAIRAYEKCGFVHEGTQREWEGRDGRRSDIINMGLLRADWEQAHAQPCHAAPARAPALCAFREVVACTTGVTMSTLTPALDLPTLAGFTFRPYRGEGDVPAMLDVLRASKAADQHEDVDTLATMLNQYRHLTNTDPARDIVLVEGPAGLVAYGRTFWVKEDGVEAYQYPVIGFVRPEARRQGLGRALLAWLEARALAIAAEQGFPRPPAAPAYWQAFANEKSPANLALLAHAGYTPVRYFYEMVRPNLDDIPDMRLPAGLEVRPALPRHYQAIWDANVEAFRDHWGETERTADDYARWLSDEREFQPAIWKVAWDTAKNEVAGMVLGYIIAEQNQQFNRLRGWTENICVRRPYRKQGVASALIAENLRELKARGMTEAALGVDTENPTGALGVYEAMGFRPVQREAVYRKPFPVAAQP